MASALEIKKGWIAANAQFNSSPFPSLYLEAGYKPTSIWSLYADTWYMPFQQAVGGDLGARWKDRLDIYSGIASYPNGRYSAEVGLKYKF